MRFRERLQTALLVISTACAMSTLGRAQDFPMGTNLSGISYYGNNWPFRDAFKCSSPWLNADWREAAAGEFAMDARGWITSLRPGQIARTIIFGGEGVRYPAGRYTVLYEGEGTLEYSSNVRVVESSPGRQVVQVDNAPADQEIQGGGVGLYITSIVASNPLRNIRFFLPGLETGGGYFNPVFLDRIRPFRTLRFTCWNQGLLPEYESQTWAERPVLGDARWSVKGVPLEVVCALSNELGADPWINLCYTYSDEDMRQCALRVRELLAPGLRVYVEYSNEVWNPIFPAADHARRRGVALNLGADGDLREGPCEAQIRFYSLRARQTFQAFEGVFPPERLVRVLATQSGSSWITRTELDFPETRAHSDVLATGAYFGYPLGAPTELARVRAMDVQVLMSELQSVAVPASGTDMVIDSTLAREYGLPFVAYEGGQHLAGFGGAEDDPGLNRLFDAANRHPGMGDRYTQLLQLWGGAGGGLFMNAYDCERYDKHGRWGALEYLDQPRSEAPKYDALMRYLETNRSPMPPALVDPRPGSLLTSPTTTFTWTAGTGVYEYWLSVYSPEVATQANELYSRTSGIALSATVSGLPTNGAAVLVRLSYRTSVGWRSVQATYIGGMSESERIRREEEQRRQEARRAEIERLRTEAARRRAEAQRLSDDAVRLDREGASARARGLYREWALKLAEARRLRARSALLLAEATQLDAQRAALEAQDPTAPPVSEEERARQEAARRAEEERRAREEAARRAEEERRAREEAARRAEEERRAREQAARRAELDRLGREIASRVAEVERLRVEAARLLAEVAQLEAQRAALGEPR